jgi:hypothetical protein
MVQTVNAGVPHFNRRVCHRDWWCGGGELVVVLLLLLVLLLVVNMTMMLIPMMMCRRRFDYVAEARIQDGTIVFEFLCAESRDTYFFINMSTKVTTKAVQ